MKRFYLSAGVVAASLALPGLPALAQTNEITIGISITTTGPAAALGIPERNALDFVAKEIAGVTLKVIVLDGGAGVEAGCGESRCDPDRRVRHRGGFAASRAAQPRLQGPDLSDSWRREHGFHPHRRKGGGGRADGIRSGYGSRGSARQRTDQ